MQNGEGGRAGIQEIGVEHFIGISFPGSFLKGFFQFPDLEKSHGVGEVAAGGVNDVLVNVPDAVGGIDAVGLQECSKLLLVPVPIMNPKVTQGIKAVSRNGIVLQDLCHFLRCTEIPVGVDLRVGGITLCVSRKIQHIPKRWQVFLARITVLVQVAGVALMGQGVEQAAVTVPGGAIHVNDIGSRFINRRCEVESGTEKIFQ